MKIKTSSRVTAIILALMMIVPLISVPAFAEDATATLLWSTDFSDAKSDSDTEGEGTVAISNSGTLYDQIKDINGNKVYYFDMSNGPETVCETSSSGAAFPYYIATAATSNWNSVPASYVTENADGTFTGKAYSSALGKTTVYFHDAVLNTDYCHHSVTAYSDDTYETEVGSIYFCTAQVAVANGKYGTTPKSITSKNVVQTGSITTDSDIVTYSADYYFDGNWGATFETDTVGGSFQFVQITSVGDGRVLQIANQSSSTLISGAAVLVEKDTWFNLTIVANYTDATYTVYVDGNEAFNATGANVSTVQAATETQKVNTWSVGQINRYSRVSDLTGSSYMVDNCAIYAGEYVPANTFVSTKYLYEATFNDNLAQLSTCSSNPITENSTFVQYTDAYSSGDKAVMIDTNTNGQAANAETNPTVNDAVNRNMTVNHPALSSNTYVFEIDYYLQGADDVTMQIQSQLRKYYAAEYVADDGVTRTAKYWLSLYSISVTGNKATLSPSYPTKTSIPNSALPTNTWFTLSAQINFSTGDISIYINGTLYNNGNLGATDIQLDAAGGGWIVAKLPKTSTSWKGVYAVDNVAVYEGAYLPTKYFNYDYYNDKVGAPVKFDTTGAPEKPISAKYGMVDDDIAVKFDMIADLSGLTARVTSDFFGATDRLYNLTYDAFTKDLVNTAENKMGTDGTAETYPAVNVVDNPDFDPDNPAIEDLTLIHTSYKDGNTMRFVARKGDKVYTYGVNGTYMTALVAEGVTSMDQLKPAGTFNIISKDADNAEGMYEAFIGSYNSDAMFRPAVPAYAYDATEGAVNTYVFSANYYVDADAKGKMESQFYTTSSANNKLAYFSLYTFNFTNTTFTVGNQSVKFDLDIWNNVTMLVTLTESAGTTVEVYFNGVLINSLTHANIAALDENAWSVAKIMKNSSTVLNAGSFYVDDISCSEYDVDKHQKDFKLDDVVLVAVDGVQHINTRTGSANIYGATVTTAEDYFKANTLITTTDYSSIRLTSGKDTSGLRFATQVHTDVLAAIEALGMEMTEMGTLIAPADFVEKYGELSLEDEDYVVNETILQVIAGKYYDKTVGTDASATHFVGSIVNLIEGDGVNAPNNIKRDFSGRGYVTITLANGNEVHVYSANTKSISVAEQAYKTLSLYTEEDDGYEIIKGYADQYVDPNATPAE